MFAAQSLPWMNPLEVAAAIDEPYWVLLHSSTRTDYSGRYSILAHRLNQRIEAKDFAPLEKMLSDDKSPFDNAWFGYLGYGLKDCLETLPADASNWLRLPNLCMMRFDTVLRFDHALKKIEYWSDRPITSLPAKSVPTFYPKPVSLTALMGQNEYLKKAAQVIAHIHAGELYQANLTRKFIGNFTEAPDGFSLFAKLCSVSPAPYSAFLRLNDTYVISSSPELFLHIDSKGHMRTRPIKGTAPRHAQIEQDKASRDALANSTKDKAENLMITDLMRNDFSRSCIPGTVNTESLFDVTTHATIHHMSSTITGQKRTDCSTLEAVKYCFPPGSMTGAPKIKAMQLCSQLERLERGVYGGAIGWFGGDGSAEFSVVIRTLLLKGQQFEFQVGGGIVADSTPAQELQELIDKSRGILTCLGLSAADIAV